MNCHLKIKLQKLVKYLILHSRTLHYEILTKMCKQVCQTCFKKFVDGSTQKYDEQTLYKHLFTPQPMGFHDRILL